MNSFLIIALGVSNLFLALFTFVLLARPEKLLGLLALAAGVREEWRLGYLMESERKRLIHLGRSLGIPLLLFLFTWSFLCGVLIRLLG
jgi:hypothetical protein